MTDRPSFLPYARQSIDEGDISAVAEVLRSDWLTTGPTVTEFENAFADKVGAPHAVACSSGTAALHLAALALDLGPGDWVIVPTNTFLATANAVRFVGAEVIFADVGPDSGLMRPHDLERALGENPGKRVKAVFPVHFAGPPVDAEAIYAVSRAAGLAVVEDACHALGTVYRAAGGDRRVGACGHADMAAFSLHPVKAIACGEGGMVTTRDAGLETRLRRLRNHNMVSEAGELENAELAFDAGGAPNPWYYEMPAPGFNYRLSDIHCALGLSQLARLDDFIRRRRDLVARYDRLIAGLAPTVTALGRVADAAPAWHLYPALIDFSALDFDRAELMRRLRQRGIGTQVHYLPVHLQPYYRHRYGEKRLPGALRYYQRCLSLPLFPAMADADVARVVAALSECCGGGRKGTGV